MQTKDADGLRVKRNKKVSHSKGRYRGSWLEVHHYPMSLLQKQDDETLLWVSNKIESGPDPREAQGGAVKLEKVERLRNMGVIEAQARASSPGLSAVF